MADTAIESPDAGVAEAPVDDTSTPVVPDAPTTPIEAEAAESTEAAEAEAAEAPGTSERVTLEEAFEAALAEAPGDEDAESDLSSEAPETGDSQPPEGQLAESEPEAAAAIDNSQSVTSPDLERINTFLKQGREAELTPAQQGTLRVIRENAANNVRAEMRQQNEERLAYLQGEEWEIEDPDAYKALLASEQGPAFLQFRRVFRAKHPEVSLEHPSFGDDTSTGVDRKQVEQDVRASVLRDQSTVLAEIAAGNGIPRETFDALEAKTGGGYAMIPHLVAEAVKVGIEKARPALAAAEKTAALQEASALKIAAAATPRQIAAGSTARGKARDKPYDNIGQALEEALAEAEAAG